MLIYSQCQRSSTEIQAFQQQADYDDGPKNNPVHRVSLGVIRKGGLYYGNINHTFKGL
jgi:hypothetical protein